MDNNSSSQPTAIICGASSGIGAATAVLLAAEGFRVVLAARRRDRLENLAARIRSEGGSCQVLPADLSSLAQIQTLVDETVRTWGHIDVVVNSAGYASLVWLDEQDQQGIAQQIQTNLIGAIQLYREVLPVMRQQGQGQIIQIASIASWVGLPTYSIYAASKFGLKGFLESLRRECRGTGITVSAVYPGAVDTEFVDHADVDWEIRGVTPRWLLATPEKVAERILRMIHRRQRYTVIPRVMMAAVLANSHFPGLVSWILARYFYREDGKTVAWRYKGK